MAFKNTEVKTKIKKFIVLLNKNGFKVQNVFLFGSYAKNNYTKDSDIDIAIISDTFTGNRFLDVQKILTLRREIDIRIEPVPFRPEDFNDYDPLVIQIKKSGERIL